MKIASTQYTLNTSSFEIYLSGCNGYPKCSGCHNEELWDFEIGENYNSDLFNKIKEKITRFDKIINNIMIMGGEPLDQNLDELLIFINALKIFNKPLWLFTRYELNEIDNSLLNLFDYIKTGKYLKQFSCEDNIKYGIKLSTSNQTINKRGVNY